LHHQIQEHDMSDLALKARPTAWLTAYRHHRNRSAEVRTPMEQQLRDIKRDINTKGLTRGAC
jgi:hypothetical protein